jgi:hypothetical protein
MLRMPGLSGLVAWFDVEFAYTRPVPCEAASTARSCIELLVHMTPRWDAMQSLTEGARRELNLAPGQPLQYWSAVYLRIVTDPRTLMVHLTDTRRYWHVAYATVPSDTLENVSERTVATFTYH